MRAPLVERRRNYEDVGEEGDGNKPVSRNEGLIIDGRAE